jgi:hypothetical protein
VGIFSGPRECLSGHIVDAIVVRRLLRLSVVVVQIGASVSSPCSPVHCLLRLLSLRRIRRCSLPRTPETTRLCSVVLILIVQVSTRPCPWQSSPVLARPRCVVRGDVVVRLVLWVL